METIVIAGIGSVVGANLAASLSGRFRVVGLSFSNPVSIEGCETACCARDDEIAVRHWIGSVRPQWIVYCGAAADSTWQIDRQTEAEPPLGKLDVHSARIWAKAARESICRLTVISSDAVFTGPWMFHKENSTCLCDSLPARTIREIEQVTTQLCPGTLVVRTNAYGWTPESVGPGWLETILEELNLGTAGPFDFLSHATPILATDLGDILCQAYQQKLEGVYHIAGSERVNSNQFVERLADEFGLPAPQPVEGNTLMERPTGFGRGETSLHSSRIRKALGIAMPALTDGLQRFREQKHNGYCDRLALQGQIVEGQVA
ncbi:MAG: sugar nucleotide-binding protein [Planctomycetes bacterium]|nr:sugar nucleotide-binding protein [Planctomycetota bacterium]